MNLLFFSLKQLINCKSAETGTYVDDYNCGCLFYAAKLLLWACTNVIFLCSDFISAQPFGERRPSLYCYWNCFCLDTIRHLWTQGMIREPAYVSARGIRVYYWRATVHLALPKNCCSTIKKKICTSGNYIPHSKVGWNAFHLKKRKKTPTKHRVYFTITNIYDVS